MHDMKTGTSKKTQVRGERTLIQNFQYLVLQVLP